MNRLLHRIVALLLIPCVILDPVMVMGSFGSVGAGHCPLPPYAWHGGLPLQLFASEALAEPSLFDNPITRDLEAGCDVRRQAEAALLSPAAPAALILSKEKIKRLIAEHLVDLGTIKRGEPHVQLDAPYPCMYHGRAQEFWIYNYEYDTTPRFVLMDRANGRPRFWSVVLSGQDWSAAALAPQLLRFGIHLTAGLRRPAAPAENNGPAKTLSDFFADSSNTQLLIAEVKEGKWTALETWLENQLRAGTLSIEPMNFGAAVGWLIQYFQPQLGKNVRLTEESLAPYNHVSDLLALYDLANGLPDAFTQEQKCQFARAAWGIFCDSSQTQRFMRSLIGQLGLSAVAHLGEGLNDNYLDKAFNISRQELDELGDVASMGERAVAVAKSQKPAWYREDKNFVGHQIVQGYTRIAGLLQNFVPALAGAAAPLDGVANESVFEGIYASGQRLPTKSEGLKAITDSNSFIRYRGALILAAIFFADDVNDIYPLLSLTHSWPSAVPPVMYACAGLVENIVEAIARYTRTESKFSRGYRDSDPLKEVGIAFESATVVKHLIEEVLKLVSSPDFRDALNAVKRDPQEWVEAVNNAQRVTAEFLSRLGNSALAIPRAPFAAQSA